MQTNVSLIRGASRTRRWSGRTFQPQNLPGRGLPDQQSTENWIVALKHGNHTLLFDDQMLYASAALRGVLVAPEGKTLAVADLSNIEGRILAYLAGEEWKLRAFAQYDQGKGPDLYNITATTIIGGDPYHVAKADRNVFGKVPDLACGYQGGFGAFQQFSKAYGVNLRDYWGTIRENVDSSFIVDATDNYATWGRDRNPDADEYEWLATEVVKLAWRARHRRTCILWRSCERAALSAMQKPGYAIPAGAHLYFSLREHAGRNYLLCRLPSGKFLCYFDPRVSAEGKITYAGQDPVTKRWQRAGTYGGKFVENACQSLAADIMAANMPAIEDAGFRIVLTVHDEIVAEVAPHRTGDELAAMMAAVPDWLAGFPLAAEGFTCRRYQKG